MSTFLGAAETLCILPGMTMRTATRSLLGLCLLTAGACDDAAEQRKPGPTPTAEPAKAELLDVKKKTTPPPPTITPPTVAAPTTDTTGIVRQYSTCYSACFSERASATNRETCKLNCDTVAETALEGIKTGAPPKDAFMKTLTTFNGCVNACYDDKTLNATNRATCVLTCQDNAEIAAATK
jgi:hypothetical protein